MNLADKFHRLALAIVLAWGWKRAALAFVAGACSVAAMAPFNAWPVLFITLPVLVWLIDGAGSGRWGGLAAAAWTGYCFGLGYFIAGLYWTGYAFFVEADVFAWLSPLAVLGLPSYLALFPAFGLFLARLLWTRDASRILAFAACLTIAEWLRGHFLTGFPWNTFGYALSEPTALAQTASLIGMWGMTFLALAIFASPAVLITRSPTNRLRLLAPLSAVAALLIMGGFGVVRMNQTPTTFVEGARLRLMQPNLPQDAKFNYSAKKAVMDKYLALSDRASGPQSRGISDVTILIWPESAFPFFLTREGDVMAQIAAFLPRGTVLVTGATRAAEERRSGPVRHAYNSIYVITHDGGVAAAYDKLHLVPFGEFLPFQDLLEAIGLQQLTRFQGGYLPGAIRHVLALPNVPPALPLICYEAIFGDDHAGRDEKPGWIINLTNDGWFGNSTGPYQHLAQARMRAIEQGLPLVRAANTGISAVIDPIGRTQARLDLGVEGILDAGLPAALSPTIYARFGDLPAAVIIVLSLLIALRRRLS